MGFKPQNTKKMLIIPLDSIFSVRGQGRAMYVKMDEIKAITKVSYNPSELKEYEGLYRRQVLRGCVGEKTQFEYAIRLVHSHYQEDMKNGVSLLEDLLRSAEDDSTKMDYLFFTAVGYTKLKEYQQALKYANAVLHIDPKYRQARHLQTLIHKKMETEGLMGMAILGGAVVLVASLVGLGITALKK